MKYFLVAAALLLSSPCFADEAYVECSYVLPHYSAITLVETPSRAAEWLQAMAKDHSIPGWNAKQECHAIDDTKREYTLFIQTENGQVSLSHGLTYQECEHVLYPMQHHDPCFGQGSCTYSESPSDYKTGECFK